MSSSSDEEDLHQCGRCREIFHSIDVYLFHKKSKSCQRSKEKDRLSNSTEQTSEDKSLAPPQENLWSFDPEVEASDAPPTCDHATKVMPQDVIGAASDSPNRLISDVSPETQGFKRPRSSSGDEKDSSGDTHPKQRGRPSRFINFSEYVKQHGQASPASKSFGCPKCAFQSEDWVEFDRHLRRSHNLSQYWCKTCQMPFSDRYKLKRHTQAKSCAPKSDNTTEPKAFVPFKSSSKLFYKVSSDSSDLRDESPETETPSESSKDFHCRQCSWECASYLEIQEHLAVDHPGLQPGVCKFCGQWFRVKHHLWRHLASSLHDDISDALLHEAKSELEALKVIWPRKASDSPQQKQMKCPSCQKKFSTKAYLEKHISRTHGSQTENVSGCRCLICYKIFRSVAKLKSHMIAVHRELKASDECVVCQRKFKNGNQMIRHMAQLHTPVLQGPLEELLLLESEESHLQLLSSAVDEEHHSTKCFVCSFIDLNGIHNHLQSHRVWVPHPVKGCIPPELFSSDLVPPPVTESKIKRRYSGLPKAAEEPSDPEEGSSESHLNTIDHDVLTDLIKEINKVNQVLDAGEEISNQMDTISEGLFSSSSQDVRSEQDENHHLLCYYCMESFPKLKDLHAHKKNDHQLELYFQCCQDSCRETFRSVVQYQMHSQNHTQGAFICRMCNHHAESMAALTSHRQTRHRNYFQSGQNANFLCQLCNKKFETLDELASHASGQSSHFLCKVCGRMFGKKSELVSHQGAHAGTSPLLCDQCGNTFKNKLSLLRHRMTHSKDKEYKCDQCSASFNKSEYLRRHVASKHSEARPFVCTYPGCGKGFKRKDKLKDHFRVHSDERNYACKICGRKYRYRDGLTYHMQTHARGNQLKCSVCGVNTTRPSQLRQHMKEVHEVNVKESHVYYCSECNSTFSRPERVKRHMEKEHNIRAVWTTRCETCHKGFSGPKSLERHVRLKHGTKKAKVTGHEPESKEDKKDGVILFNEAVGDSQLIRLQAENDWSLVSDQVVQPVQYISLEPASALPTAPSAILSEDDDKKMSSEKSAQDRSDKSNAAFIAHDRVLHIMSDSGEKKAVNTSHGKRHEFSLSVDEQAVPPTPPSHFLMPYEAQAELFPPEPSTSNPSQDVTSLVTSEHQISSTLTIGSSPAKTLPTKKDGVSQKGAEPLVTTPSGTQSRIMILSSTLDQAPRLQPIAPRPQPHLPTLLPDGAFSTQITIRPTGAATSVADPVLASANTMNLMSSEALVAPMARPAETQLIIPLGMLTQTPCMTSFSLTASQPQSVNVSQVDAVQIQNRLLNFN